MRRIQGEAKSHAAPLSLKCDPGDHTRSSAGCVYMHCLMARLKTHARALMSPEHIGGLNTFVGPWTQQGEICALQVKVWNALKKSAIKAAVVQHQGQFYCRGSRTDDTCPRASEIGLDEAVQGLLYISYRFPPSSSLGQQSLPLWSVISTKLSINDACGDTCVFYLFNMTQVEQLCLICILWWLPSLKFSECGWIILNFKLYFKFNLIIFTINDSYWYLYLMNNAQPNLRLIVKGPIDISLVSDFILKATAWWSTYEGLLTFLVI